MRGFAPPVPVVSFATLHAARNPARDSAPEKTPGLEAYGSMAVGLDRNGVSLSLEGNRTQLLC